MLEVASRVHVKTVPKRITGEEVAPSWRRAAGTVAFTLVELMVVIAVIGLLAALLLPALAGGKERARRVVCVNHLRQLIVTVHLYADENSERVFSGLSENADSEDAHIPVISGQVRTQFLSFLGDFRLLECPGLGPPFGQPEGWYYPRYGYVMGYNYLGGHTNTPWPAFREFSGWISPQRTTDNNTQVLFADLNDWSPGYGKSFAPHGSTGPILRDGDFTNPSADGASSKEIGAAGGNVGLLDGSVNWKPIGQMQPYRGSRRWGSGGCFALW